MGHNYTNWELSAERALVARKTLQFGGVRSKQILQVSGMADRVLAVPQDPYNPENRRIEILILTQKASDKLEQELGGSIVPKAEKIAADNRPEARYPQAESHLER